jgi:NH3-dependent NAD+ synthetase
MRYDVLDQLLHGLHRGDAAREVASRVGVDRAAVDAVQRMMAQSRHMRELPPAPRLPGVP